jgi:hypothetical protein
MSDERFESFQSPAELSEEAAMPYEGEPEPAAGPTADVLRRRERELLAIDGVVGARLGRTEIGDDAIVLLLRDASVAERTPEALEGLPVRTIVTGPIDAQST